MSSPPRATQNQDHHEVPNTTHKKNKIDFTKHATDSPLVRKNQKLLDEATAILETGMSLNVLTESRTVFVIKLHVQFKLDLRYTVNQMVGKFIVYDDYGQSANLVCCGQPHLSNVYLEVNEMDYIEVTNGKVVPADRRYTLCNSKYDILVSSATKIRKITISASDNPYTPPFLPSSIQLITAEINTDDVVDCVGFMEGDPEVVQGIPNSISASVVITDFTGSITLTAWGQASVTCLKAASLSSQKVFAFQRLKRNKYLGNAQLFFNYGADILLDVNHEAFHNLKKYYYPDEE